jgi:hypothetical protein
MIWNKEKRTTCDSNSGSDMAGRILTSASPLYDATLKISIAVIFYAVQQ